MMPMKWGLSLALLLALAAVSYWAGDHNRNNAWLAQQAKQEHAALVQLQAAQARGDALSAGLLAQQTRIDALKKESRRALSEATSGRPCLDAAALRVLDAAPGIDVMPAPAGDAAATDERFASDTDIGLWAAEAGAHFETCRARLDALIDWHAP